ncbi:MAG TPA: hypothetical protein VK933_14970 [Longimicrobiales bacterium]|nr:hypothetical protein [Longimicrobiales bacterium]
MARRIRNVVMFVAAVLAVGLLMIGVIALMDGDASGWRAVIGSILAFTLALSVGLRARSARSGWLPG